MSEDRRTIENMYDEVKAWSKSLPYVRTSSKDLFPFDPDRIIESLIVEAEVPRKTAIKIAWQVVQRIYHSGIEFLSGPLIREMCNSVLAEMGLEEARKKYTRVGVPLYDLNKIIANPSIHASNAHLAHNPESVAKVIHDEVMEQHTFLTIPTYIADAHMKGEIYIDNIQYFTTRDEEYYWDLRLVLKNGIEPDGMGGIHSNSAAPAKHIEVALNHAATWLTSAQNNFAGSQGFFYFNTFLAPYLKGLTQKEIIQRAQQFVYTMSQQYVSRGGQVIFSSISLTPGIPDVLRDVPAILPGGIRSSNTYEDYEEEANAFFNAILEVFSKSDAKGRPFKFPKIEIITDMLNNKKFEDSLSKVTELSSKFGTPQFVNFKAHNILAGSIISGDFIFENSDSEKIEAFKNGKYIFGSSSTITPNYARAAWHGRNDERRFFEILNNYLDLVKQAFATRKEILHRIIKKKIIPFYDQKLLDGEPIIKKVDKNFLIGIVGLDTTCKIVTESRLHEKEGSEFAAKVIRYTEKIAKEIAEELEINIALTRSPGELVGGQLAMKDYMRFPGMRKYIRGTEKAPYYTPAIGVPEDVNIELNTRLKIEATASRMIFSGAPSQIFVKGLASPSKINTVLQNTIQIGLGNFAFTVDSLYCPKCRQSSPANVMFENKKIYALCPKCNSESLEIVSRISTYLQNIQNWNPHKRQEFIERYRYIF